MIESQSYHFDQIMHKVEVIEMDLDGFTQVSLSLNTKLGTHYLFDFFYKLKKDNYTFYFRDELVARKFQADVENEDGFTMPRAYYYSDQNGVANFSDIKFTSAYLNGEKALSELMNEYLMFFEKTSNNTTIALNYFVEKCVLHYKSKGRFYDLDIETIGYQQGLLKSIYVFIYNHHELLSLDNFGFITNVTDKSFVDNQVKSLKILFPENFKMMYDVILHKLIIEGVIKENHNQVNDRVELEWVLGVNAKNTGASNFVSLLNVIEEKGFIDMINIDGPILKRITDNTFKNTFKSDTLKKGDINDAGINKCLFFKEILKEWL